MARKLVALMLLALLAFSTKAQNESVLARIQWLNGQRLAATTCEGEMCRAIIVDLPHTAIKTVEFGPYLPEAYLEWRDSYIVTRLSDGAIGLWDATGQFRPYASGEQVDSRPIVSPDGRYIALRLTTSDGPRLRVLDLFDSKLHRTLPLEDELPETDAVSIGLYPPLPEFGRWDEGTVLSYVDDGRQHFFVAISGEEIIAECFDATALDVPCPPEK